MKKLLNILVFAFCATATFAQTEALSNKEKKQKAMPCDYAENYTAVSANPLLMFVGLDINSLVSSLSNENYVVAAKTTKIESTLQAKEISDGYSAALVDPSLVITSQPLSSYACSGSDASFTVTAEVAGIVDLLFELQALVNGNWSTFAMEDIPLVDGPETVTLTLDTDNFENCTQVRFSITANGDPTCTVESDAVSMIVHDGGPIACNNKINLSLDDDCTAQISATSFIEGDVPGCSDGDEETYMNLFYSVHFEAPDGSTFSDPAELGNYTGSCLTYVVTDQCTGQTCWGTVCLEDKQLPTLTCECPVGGDPITGEYSDVCKLRCFQVDLLRDGIEDVLSCDYLPFPALSDNCTSLANLLKNIEYNDEVIGRDNCEDYVYRRNFVIYTEQYNEATGIVERVVADECTYEFLVEPYNVQDTCGINSAIELSTVTEEAKANKLFLPISVIVLSCDDETSPESLKTRFDNPITMDASNTEVVENCEGTPYAYPFYYAEGTSCIFHPQKIDNGICNIATTYTDNVLDACGDDCQGNQKTVREWVMVDWCTHEVVRWDQLIKTSDNEAPLLIVGNTQASVDPWDCLANFDLPIPTTLHDNCYGPVSYYVGNGNGFEVTGDDVDGFRAHNIPKSMPGQPWIFYYYGVDCCGNVTEPIPVEVIVADKTAPVAVTLQNYVVNLTNNPFDTNGIAKIFASDFDNGSYDLCGDVHLEVRRMIDNCGQEGSTTFNNNGDPDDDKDDEDEGAYVKFCCDDLTDEENGFMFGEFEVEIRVWDDGNMNGIYGDTDASGVSDNYNTTWAIVRVEDKLPAAPNCPENLIMTCDWDPYDLTITGVPTIISACGIVDTDWEHDVNIITTPATKRPTDAPELNQFLDNPTVPPFNPSCRTGALRRTFGGCVQWIILEPKEPLFDPSTIEWPEDKAVNCLDTEVDEPSWLASACELIAWGVEPDTFYLEEGACVKIHNNYSIINWCNYDGMDSDLNDIDEPEDDFIIPGLHRYTQFVTLVDNTDPTCEMIGDTCFAVDENCVGTSFDISFIGDDEGDCPSPWIKWEIILDLWADNTPDYNFSSDILHNDPFYVAPTARGEQLTITFPAGIDPSKVEHNLVINVKDGCGNVTTKVQKVLILDKKKPTPYCLNISTAVMENGEVELWAKDFNAGSFDNCTAVADMLFTFSDVPPPPRNDAVYAGQSWYDGSYWYYDILTGDYAFGYGPDIHKWTPSERTSGRLFTATDLANNGGDTFELPVYAWDECGNTDYCTVNLRLIDNNQSVRADISGQIRTEDGRDVNGVMMELMTNDPSYPANDMTQNNGEYTFSSNPMYIDYQISGEKNDDYLNGVTTLDLVLIQRHILALQNLDSGYKLIAADINNDENISAIDLIELRKLILGIYAELPQNDSWRFVPSGFTVDNTHPWPFTEIIDLIDLDQDMMDEDYVGVKIGDVNGTVQVNLNGQLVDNRSANKLTFEVEEQSYKKGDYVSVAFKANDFEQVSGYQFTLDAKGLEYQELIPGALNLTESNFGMIHGLITTSWHTDEPMSVEDDEVLFTMVFEAKQSSSNVQRDLVINDRITPAESYVGAGLEIGGVAIGGADDSIYELLQNEPNPFGGESTIGFILPQDAKALISIYDVDGKLLRTFNGEYNKGYNEIKVAKDDVISGGLYYYQLESGDFKDTKKMIVIR